MQDKELEKNNELNNEAIENESNIENVALGNSNDKQEIEVTTKEKIVKTKDEEKKDKKLKKIEKKYKQKKHTFKKYFYGVGKEFERVTWTSKKNLFTSFMVVVVVVIFFSLVFFGVTYGITAI